MDVKHFQFQDIEAARPILWAYTESWLLAVSTRNLDYSNFSHAPFNLKVICLIPEHQPLFYVFAPCYSSLCYVSFAHPTKFTEFNSVMYFPQEETFYFLHKEKFSPLES